MLNTPSFDILCRKKTYPTPADTLMGHTWKLNQAKQTSINLCEHIQYPSEKIPQLPTFANKAPLAANLPLRYKIQSLMLLSQPSSESSVALILQKKSDITNQDSD